MNEPADLEARTIARATARLVPFLVLCFFVAYLDRVNVSFAALTMNPDLGLSASAYGFGSGVFFLTYCLLEVPSNLLLERIGARTWIARIMLTWGLCSGAMALVGGRTSFFVVRALLGAAEAGFFPGIIFFLTLWFPAAYRARIVGYFMVAAPLSTAIGAPISGLILGLDGAAGLKGWQWLFVLEAIPSIAVGIVVYLFLTDRPADAAWLLPDERAWLVNRMEQERQLREAARHYSVREALVNPKILALSFVYFGIVVMNYGPSAFLPQIVKAFGVSNAQAGLLSAVPYVIGSIGVVYWGRRSDRRRERRLHTALPLAIAAIGIAAFTALDDPVLKMIAMSVAGFGIFSSFPSFWTLPTAFLSGPAAAGGIALINSIGNLAGFVGPSVVGRLKDLTGTYTAGLLSLSAAGLIAMVVVLLLEHDDSLERGPEGALLATSETPS
jgi:MFS transporter, ACS family, tartrate transporter